MVRKPRKTSIVFIGAGNMAEALIAGLITRKTVAPRQIIAVDVRPERLAALKKKYRIETETDAASAVSRGAVIFLSVKPQQMAGALKTIAAVSRPAQLFISIAAGVTTAFIENLLPAGTPVIRSMPNTPALVAAGAIAIAPGRATGKTHLARARKLFAAAGMVVELPEEQINAVTALSGSGPAYVFLLVEAMAAAGTAAGLPPKIAGQLARQTIVGAGAMLAAAEDDPAELRRRVTSPGGTTEAAIRSFEQNNFSSLVAQAVAAARNRARELST
jgi:pyrroline-5-carboxylate reductase